MYLHPPKEANANKIWKLWKCIYRLVDASSYWYLKFREPIKLGAEPSQLDLWVFIWNINNKPAGMMVCFVEDVLCWGNKNFTNIIDKSKETFQICAEHSQAFSYIGIYLKQNDDFSIIINQVDYINSINEIKVNNILERNKNDKLKGKETTSLKGTLGKISWVAGISRQEISYYVCQISTNVKMQQSQIYLPSNLLRQHHHSHNEFAISTVITLFWCQLQQFTRWR